MESWLKHVKENEDTFALWLEMNETLQPSADIFKPIIPEFLKEFPGVNINGCKECMLDMIRWARIELKKSEQGIPKSKKSDSTRTN